MMQKRFSIRQRLLVLLLGTLLVISALMLSGVRSSARLAANEAYDRVLLGSALAISERVFILGGEIDVDIPFVALEMLSSESQDRVFYQVSKQGDVYLTGYEDLPNVPDHINKIGNDPVFYDGVYNGEEVRIGMVSRFLSSPSLSTRFIVKVAETTNARDALIQKMVTEAVMRQSILIFVAGLIMWIGVSWGLKPLEHLQAALKRRNPNDLRPISHKVPEEVQHLIEGINDLMQRLAQNIDAMKRFTANAAHQLRTPLAAVQTQTELALKTDKTEELHHHLEYLKQSTQQSTRLINQLLSLARATPEEGAIDRKVVDIVSLGRNLTMQMVPFAMVKEIDLGWECDEEVLCVSANAALLEEALKNLIDNSIAYSPHNSIVTLKVSKSEKEVRIILEDNGPGIAEENLSSVFDRFDRAGRSDGKGCGLGLPIVKEIIERHDGSITLENGRETGLVITVVLPRMIYEG